MRNHKGRWVGGKRLTPAQRQEIITAYMEHGPLAARTLTDTYGLAADYAYKLVNARGLIDVHLSKEQKQWNGTASC